MSDVVVTCPQRFWEEWIAEGDAAGEPWSGEEWEFYLGGRPPEIVPGERVYIVCRRQLRGYAPLVRIKQLEHGHDEWRTLAHRAKARAERAEAALAADAGGEKRG